MKIPTTLKHKPVIVAPDYENIDGRKDTPDAKGSRSGLHSGTTAAGSIFRPRYGAIRARSGRASRRSCRFTA